MFKTSMLMLAAVASVGATLALRPRPPKRARFRRLPDGGFRGGFARFTPHRPHFRPQFHPHRPHVHVRWHRPWVYGVGTTAAAAAPPMRRSRPARWPPRPAPAPA